MPHGGQRTTCRNWFSLATTWVLGIELGSSRLVIQLAEPSCWPHLTSGLLLFPLPGKLFAQILVCLTPRYLLFKAPLQAYLLRGACLTPKNSSHFLHYLLP